MTARPRTPLLALWTVLLAVACGPVSAPAAETALAPTRAPADPTQDPNGDPDADGVLNANDACPCDAEDVDGFADDDGCPDYDNDDDGVHDACDLCPFLPETYSAEYEPDGCPDQGPVEIPPAPLVIREVVSFRARNAALSGAEAPIMSAVVAALEAHPDARVGLHGHADRGESQAQALSERRAQVVRDELIRQGVSPERLSVYGHGSFEPREPGRSPAAQQANRRVQFEVELEERPPLEPRPIMPRATPADCQPPPPSACPCARRTAPGPACRVGERSNLRAGPRPRRRHVRSRCVFGSALPTHLIAFVQPGDGASCLQYAMLEDHEYAPSAMQVSASAAAHGWRGRGHPPTSNV
ncbi:MAG: OmpA family protein [Sandaracinaceae bacterium]|nr:OmpA family protein [Sandaracinaceae bacterium]